MRNRFLKKGGDLQADMPPPPASPSLSPTGCGGTAVTGRPRGNREHDREPTTRKHQLLEEKPSPRKRDARLNGQNPLLDSRAAVNRGGPAEESHRLSD